MTGSADPSGVERLPEWAEVEAIVADGLEDLDNEPRCLIAAAIESRLRPLWQAQQAALTDARAALTASEAAHMAAEAELCAERAGSAEQPAAAAEPPGWAALKRAVLGAFDACPEGVTPNYLMGAIKSVWRAAVAETQTRPGAPPEPAAAELPAERRREALGRACVLAGLPESYADRLIAAEREQSGRPPEPAEPAPEALQEVVTRTVRQTVESLVSGSLDPPATAAEIANLSADAVVEALARFRWEAAAEARRLRALVELVVETDAAAVGELETFGITPSAESTEILRRCATALAQPASADAEALGRLLALPEKWEAAARVAAGVDGSLRPAAMLSGCARELRALLRRLGLEVAP